MSIKNIINSGRGLFINNKTAEIFPKVNYGKAFSSAKIQNIIDCQGDFPRLESIARQHLLGQNPYRELESFLTSSSLASHKVPEKMKLSMYDLKRSGTPRGFVLIRNLPSDKNLMDTPQDLKEVSYKKESFFSEFWLATIAHLLGEPFSYVQENAGLLFHNVRPSRTHEKTLSSESSKILLDLHSETAFHPFYPDYLFLFCLRTDRNKEALTIISSIDSIKDKISPGLESTLRKPLFRTGIDFSFGSENLKKGNGPIIPILKGDQKDLHMIFDPDLMEGVTAEAKEAIQELKFLFDSAKEGVLLEEGDLLVVDNHRAVHGRNQFNPNFDGKDRWLQRLYVTESLKRASLIFGKKERIITYKFSGAEKNDFYQ